MFENTMSMKISLDNEGELRVRFGEQIILKVIRADITDLRLGNKRPYIINKNR